MKSLYKKEDLISLTFLFQWSCIAILAGAVGNLCVHGLVCLVVRLNSFLLSIRTVPQILWPLLGAIPVGFLVYRAVPGAMGEGIPSYLESVRRGNGRLSFRETAFKFFAALLTLGTLGNGGAFGPSGRMSAGLMSSLGKHLTGKWLPESLMQIFPICGMAAAMGALIHSPIGGGLFAVEIILKTNMRYKQIFPAVLASTSSVFIARHLGLEPIIQFPAIHGIMDVNILPVLLLLTFSAGFLGKLFISSYKGISILFHRNRKSSIRRRTLYMIIGSLTASIVYFINPSLMGLSSELFKAILSGARVPLYGNLPHTTPILRILFVMFILKAMGNIFTVGSGMSAGFAGPAILMGLLLGAGFAEVFAIPFGSVEYFALLAAGFAGYFSSIYEYTHCFGYYDNRAVRNVLQPTRRSGCGYRFPCESGTYPLRSCSGRERREAGRRNFRAGLNHASDKGQGHID